MKFIPLRYRLFRYVILLLSIIGDCFYGFSQTASSGDIYPRTFTQYFSAPSPINPAGIGQENKVELKSITHFFTNGPFQNVYQTAGHASYRIGDSLKMKHIFGLSYQFEKDGGFLNRSRAYINYVLSRLLFPTINFSVGLAIGGFDYSVVPTNSNVGGGDLVPDGKFGVFLEHTNWSLGVSLNQLFDNTVSPFDATFDLPRYPIAYGHYRLNAGLNHVLFRARMQSQIDEFKWQGSVHYLYFSRIEMGIGLNNYFESIWNIGVTRIPMFFTELDFGLAYTQGLANTSLNTLTQLEIYLFVH